jgi:hypothetical protein
MFKSHQIKSNHRVLRKNEVDTCGAPVFAPDYSTTVLAAKMCTNSTEHSMYNIFLRRQPTVLTSQRRGSLPYRNLTTSCPALLL